ATKNHAIKIAWFWSGGGDEFYLATAGSAWVGVACVTVSAAGVLGAWACSSTSRFSISPIFATNCSSTFLRSLLFTMLKLASSRTTLVVSVSNRVIKP